MAYMGELRVRDVQRQDGPCVVRLGHELQESVQAALDALVGRHVRIARLLEALVEQLAAPRKGGSVEICLRTEVLIHEGLGHARVLGEL